MLEHRQIIRNYAKPGELDNPVRPSKNGLAIYFPGRRGQAGLALITEIVDSNYDSRFIK